MKCTNCGKTDTVPFEPKTDKPVYCSNCFSERRSNKPRTRNQNSSFNEKTAWARRQQSFKGKREEKPNSIFQKD
ncbi:hypothetical protein G4O51_07170 [Candidatus Bathyarchaeota archaeon A05DMB-2]|nr:hypothetical protein [Candidatus Bathyarchaeota archaeon A05DMB-2]